jgi:phytochromobilin:ferredoxin oxidoreductase
MSGGLGAGFSYQKFVHFALEQTRLRTGLAPHQSQVLSLPELISCS